MPNPARAILLASTLLSGPVPALAQESRAVEHVVVAQDRFAASAISGLDLSLRETPQSVTVISRQQIDDFRLANVNDLLDLVPGVNVERVETDRTYYNSRGFDITNFQLDGIGLPLLWGIQFGDLDTAMFERVEVVRGADGMMTGIGNPSATVNYVRKRPTRDMQASASFSYGSWNNRRFQGDLSTPLNDSGAVRARLVYANEDRDSYLDYYHVNRNVFYGVLAADVTADLTVTVGYSFQYNQARGVLWGALPLDYSDGTPVQFPVSATTSADWTFWNVKDQAAFSELTYNLGAGWLVKGVATFKQFNEHAKLLYAFGNPDPVTGLGVGGMSGIYPSKYDQYLFDLYVSGPVTVFGREHQLTAGASSAYLHGLEYEDFSAEAINYPSVFDWATQQVAQPTYPGAYLAADQFDRLHRFYAAAHVNLTDRLKSVVGFNVMKLTSKGYSYGTDTARDESAISPYAGLVYDITPQIAAYASYTDIFNPQSEVDIAHHKLRAAQGRSYEAGVKTEWLDKRLYATAALFKSEQSGLAEFAGTFADGKSYYGGIDTFVSGYELEVAGRITDQWTVAGGWTGLEIRDSAGMDVRTYLPRQTLKLSTTYLIPELNDLKLGGAVRWQSGIYTQDIGRISQDSYAVFDLLAGIRIVQGLRATINLRNIDDRKYLPSLKWNQAFYAAPRSVTFSLDYAL
jgi:outer membrane receptor for ferric coprogen and ferric-rhodotorulic acid